MNKMKKMTFKGQFFAHWMANGTCSGEMKLFVKRNKIKPFVQDTGIY